MLSANQNVAKINVTLLGDMQIKSAHGLVLIEKFSFNAHSLSNLEKGQCFMQ